MSQRIRGQEATLRLTVDGQLQAGSMFKVKDFSITPRQDIGETEYCGEDESDLDFQHHGFDMAWSVDMLDDATLKLLSLLVNTELAHRQQPKMVLTVTYKYREGALAGGGRIISMHTNLVLKQGKEGAGGRKDYVGVEYEAKCKKRDVLAA